MTAVPFFWIDHMERSLAFYREGLGFTMKHSWLPDGKLEWCWLTRDGASIMLQQYREGRRPEGKRGLGIDVCFMCDDAIALYREFRARGIATDEPFVGNHLWVTGLTDPDGFRLFFESPTDVAEETRLSEIEPL